MEAILIFLAKAGAGGVLGHYLKKGLEAIDEKLADLFEAGSDRKEIEQYIQEQGIENKVVDFATKAMEDAFVIPAIGESTPTYEVLSQFFEQVIGTGFDFSKSLQLDLLLPGSILGGLTMSLFKGNRDHLPEYDRSGVSFRIRARSIIENELFIFPTKSAEHREKVWNQYKENVRSARKDSSEYLDLNKDFSFLKRSSERCRVEYITAGSCQFKRATIMSSYKRRLLGVKGDTAPIGDWQDGVDRMIGGLIEILDILTLPVEIVGAIQERSKRFSELLGKYPVSS